VLSVGEAGVTKDADVEASTAVEAVPVGKEVVAEANSVEAAGGIPETSATDTPSINEGGAAKADVVEEVKVVAPSSIALSARELHPPEAPATVRDTYAKFADFGLDDLE
jgi:hypothetical protein